MQFTHNGFTAFSESKNALQGGEEVPEKGLFSEAYFVFKVGNLVLGSFRMSPMPGCCGVVISHDTHLNPQHRNSGYSDRFRELKEALAKHLGYSVVIATTQMHNLPAVGNMYKSKYNMVDTFKNSRTNNLIGIGIKHLT